MAHLSQDKNMIDAFLSGYDIHAATAAKIYKVDINDVTADMRRKAKTTNFGIITASPSSGWRAYERSPSGSQRTDRRVF